MRVLDLFSGIGGFSLGLERAGMETVAFCEIEPFCQKALKKHWPDVPIFNDVRNLDYDGTVDVICGGFPCQPFSVAGKQKGKDDDRHLWPAMFDLIKKYKPNWVIGENVAGIINMGLDDVLTSLEGEGYTARAFVIPACAVNAPHRRDRVWIVANSNGERCDDGSDYKQKRHLQNKQNWNDEEDKPKRQRWESGVGSNFSDVTHSDNERLQRRLNKFYDSEGWNNVQKQIMQSIARTRDIYNNLSTPRVCRSNDGISNRTHRLKALGNAVVPQIPEIIGRAIMEIERAAYEN